MKNARPMKITPNARTKPKSAGGMRTEYSFDYRKARPNRFAGRADGDRLVVVLDPDIARVFTTPRSVNAVLRALIKTMPPSSQS